MASSHITVNGTSRPVDGSTPLTDILQEAGIDPSSARGVAVAVNEEVVRRPEWNGTTLHAGDRIEIIRATQGG